MEPRLIALTDAWCVLGKPAGWLTIPGRDPVSPPVVTDWAKRVYGPIWVVHRLDRETSGVLLLARNEKAHREANTWFADRRVRKEYDAIASGRPEMPVLALDQPMPDGRAARTQIEVIEQGRADFLARARPLTGRRHQIRIHLSGAGHPIWGDIEYGGSRAQASRVALHARMLELPERRGHWEDEWPEDFAGWVTRLRSGVGGA